MNRKSKIVATIGPASQDESIIKQLILAGMDVARINFSHGTQQDHADSINHIRQASLNLKRPITILLDLQGPKIRTGELEKGEVELKAGQPFILTTKRIVGNEEQVSVDFPGLPSSVHQGGRILLDDGHLELKILSVGKYSVKTRVVVGGFLKPHKGVNLPGATIKVPALTEKDKSDLKFGLEHGVDIIALSFVRSSKDISRLRQEINKISPSNADIPIIAKLEHPDALKNLHEIIHITDGVMVARGDLGVELNPEDVPIAQKRIILMANQHLKIVITATQMLDSMIHNPRPTRAEASDVANAIFDGSDAVMLSGETAIGKYPIESVKMMSAIIEKSEEHMKEWGIKDKSFSADLLHDNALYVTRAATELAHDKDVSAIAVSTASGRTARLMSKARPDVPILAFTPFKRVYSRLNLLWGVIPYLIPQSKSVEEMLAHVEAAIISATPYKPGQEVVLIAGFPVGQKKPANFALLHTIGQP
ncbi:MAG: pyruvate kinase [Anaerolineales bacterium]|nr:pyruvate kinase [Anaerolineales bacterium]